MSHLSLATLFPGVSQNGNGFVQDSTPGAAQQAANAVAVSSGRMNQMTSLAGTGQLAGEADVMMISGIKGPLGESVNVPPVTLAGQLGTPVQIGSITLPLWQWLALALGLGAAAGYYMGRRG